jgi:vitamin B12 transporter
LKNSVLSSVIIATWFAGCAIAQEIEGELIVTATRKPALLKDVLPSSQIITQADIQRYQPRDLPSLLGRVSGVDFRDSGGRGSLSGVFIRGASPSQTIILIDGIRSASAAVGSTALELIPIESVERIEIVKGPLSGLYGADAVGGVIQIITKKGSKQRLSPGLHVRYGTDDTQDYTADLSAGNEDGGFHVSFSYENAAGFDRTTIKTGGNADRDSFDEFALNASGHYRLTDHLHAQVNVLRTDAYTEFDNLFGADRNHDSDTNIESNAVKLQYAASEALKLNFDVGYFRDESNIPVFGSSITTRRMSYLFQADYQLHENHELTAGVEYYDDRVETLSAFSQTSRDNIGGFLQWQGRYGKLSAVGSLRYDNNETYGDNTNGSIAVEYAFLANLAGVVSYGTAFRSPSFNDLFFPGFGNPNLSPEESETVEVSLKGQHLGARWRLSGYYTDVQDLIGFDPVSFTAMNTSEATLQGVEYEIAFNYAGWNINTNLNYLDARDDTTDEYLDDRAEFAANLQVYRGFGQLDVAFDLQAESGRHDRVGETLDGFAIVGTTVNYRLNKKLRVSGRLDNLFNQSYTLNLATASHSFRTYGRTATVSFHARY